MVSFKGGIGMFSWLASNLATVLICAAPVSYTHLTLPTIA